MKMTAEREATQAEAFKALKAELVRAFAAPDSTYRRVDANTVIKRNTRGA